MTFIPESRVILWADLHEELLEGMRLSSFDVLLFLRCQISLTTMTWRNGDKKDISKKRLSCLSKKSSLQCCKALAISQPLRVIKVSQPLLAFTIFKVTLNTSKTDCKVNWLIILTTLTSEFYVMCWTQEDSELFSDEMIFRKVQFLLLLT